MKEIEHHSKNSEMLHWMIPPPPLVNHLNFDGMDDYGDNILLDLASEITDLKPHTKIASEASLHHLINTRKGPKYLPEVIYQRGQIY